MPSGEPLAYFLTFATYGSWFHGDVRGSVSRELNGVGEPGIEPSPRLVRHERAVLLKAPPFVLDATRRAVVDESFRATCEARGWSLLAANVRTTHVHVVVRSDGERPEVVMTALKAFATRSLVEQSGLPRGTRIWARHGSTRYVWNERDVEAACVYTLEMQDEASGRWDSAQNP